MSAYRRRLPHFHLADKPLFITWRLWGTVPASLAEGSGRAFAADDFRLGRLDAGPLWLRDWRIAGVVSEALQIGAGQRQFYDLSAWVVMPNHVHLLAIPKVPVPMMMRWLKGSTARQANSILGRTGRPFWQDESFDHYLRDWKQVERTVNYIEQNPVKAGLVLRAEEWIWSSAGWQAEAPAPPRGVISAGK